MSLNKEKLRKRLDEEFNLNIDIYTFRRNYLTMCERSSGFVCWNAETYKGDTIGSQWPINECATSTKLEVSFSDGVYLIFPYKLKNNTLK
jgi:hypothetical protein